MQFSDFDFLNVSALPRLIMKASLDGKCPRDAALAGRLLLERGEDLI